MRKSLIIALTVVLGLTLVTFGVSYFIQPLLSPELNRILNLFFAALVGVTGVLGVVGFIEFIRNNTGKRKVELDKQQKLRNRNNMLQLVWNTWIEGVLHKSLYNEILIDLGLETRPDAIEHPWDMVIEMPNQEPEQVPPGTTMLELFDNANGALLILGEPGSGKTTLLLELASQLIGRSQIESIQPIPIIFNLSTWTPKDKFNDWLVSELRQKYYIAEKISRNWVANDDLLLLLDGLDEVKEIHREECVKAINSFRETHSVTLTICCRKSEYEAVATNLKLYAAVLIQPLTEKQMEGYLQEAGIAELEQVLKHDQELREFANTPLILSIMVLTYQNASKKKLDSLEAAIDYRKHLLDDYCDQMIIRRGSQYRNTEVAIKMMLIWLALKMIVHRQSIFNINDINLNWLSVTQAKLHKQIIGVSFGLISGLIIGLSSGLTGVLSIGLIVGMGVGLIIGVASALSHGVLVIEDEVNKTVVKTDLLGKLYLGGLILLPFIVLIGIVGIWLISKIFGLLIIGLSAGLFTGLLLGGRVPIPILEFVLKSESRESIKTSLKKTVLGVMSVGLIAGLILGISIGLSSRFVVGLHSYLSVCLIGFLFIGLIIGLTHRGYLTISNFVSRWIIFRTVHNRRLLISILDNFTKLIFLRRVGGGYIFIHRILMEHFAAMATDETE